jgi:PAS domain S-box-containing protein
VVITDPKARILAVNRAYSDITGYDEAEILGQNPRILQSGRHDRAFYQTLWTSVRNAGYWQGELWNRRKNGEIYPQWLTISVVHDGRGEATHYVGVLTDISQIKSAEERLDRLAHHDPLTDLPNRLLARLRLTHASGAGPTARLAGLACLFIDLDRFKTVNDSSGSFGGRCVVASHRPAAARRARRRRTPWPDSAAMSSWWWWRTYSDRKRWSRWLRPSSIVGSNTSSSLYPTVRRYTSMPVSD